MMAAMENGGGGPFRQDGTSLCGGRQNRRNSIGEAEECVYGTPFDSKARQGSDSE